MYCLDNKLWNCWIYRLHQSVIIYLCQIKYCELMHYFSTAPVLLYIHNTQRQALEYCVCGFFFIHTPGVAVGTSLLIVSAHLGETLGLRP